MKNEIKYKYVLKIRRMRDDIVQAELYNMKYKFEKGKIVPINYFNLCNFTTELDSILEDCMKLERRCVEINSSAEKLYSTVRYMYENNKYEVI